MKKIMPWQAGCLQRGMGVRRKAAHESTAFFEISTLFDKIISFPGDFDTDSDLLKIYIMIYYVIYGSKLDVLAEKYALLLTYNRKKCRIICEMYTHQTNQEG